MKNKIDKLKEKKAFQASEKYYKILDYSLFEFPKENLKNNPNSNELIIINNSL